MCNENHRFMVAEQMRSVERIPSAIVLESVGRNTAPAVAVATMKAMEGGDWGTMPKVISFPLIAEMSDRLLVSRLVNCVSEFSVFLSA